MGNAIEVRDLVKRYGTLTAVNGVSFSVAEGALFAFLGPNGAGKTTTINVLCTMLAWDKGEVRVNGHRVGEDDDEVRKAIGVVFQHPVLDDLLTVRENLAVRASFYGLHGQSLRRRIDLVTELLGLDEFLDRRYGKLSGGQRRRADVARALLNTPRILFLDEPTTGLDPQTRLRLWNSLHEMRRSRRMTVFLTTHYMEEAAVADDVAIVDRGTIAAQGTPVELKRRYSSDTLSVTARHRDRLMALLQREGLRVDAEHDPIRISLSDSMQALSILKRIEGYVSSFEVIAGSMDSVFMNVTGHAIREEVKE